MIDMIYIINLNEAIERKKNIIKQMSKSNINDEKYNIFNVTKPTNINEVNKYNPRFSTRINDLPEHRLTTFGCMDSHVKVMKDALDKNYENILIFEDDVNILNDKFMEITQKYIKAIMNNKKFNMLYLVGGHHKKHQGKLTDNIFKITHTNGTIAYAISKEFMKIIVNDFDSGNIVVAIDVYYRQLQRSHDVYCIIPHIACHGASYSYIHNKKIDDNIEGIEKYKKCQSVLMGFDIDKVNPHDA